MQQAQKKSEELLQQVASKDVKLSEQTAAIEAASNKHQATLGASEESVSKLTSKVIELENEVARLSQRVVGLLGIWLGATIAHGYNLRDIVKREATRLNIGCPDVFRFRKSFGRWCGGLAVGCFRL